MELMIDDELMREAAAPLKRLGKDLKLAAATLSAHEARYLVDLYYQMQRNRVRSNNQVTIMAKGGEPHAVVSFFRDQSETVENQIKSALQGYAQASPLGEWALGIYGLGPVITAGLLAHIDFAKARHAGSVIRFAGLDPTLSWTSKEAANDLVKQRVKGNAPTQMDILVIENHLNLKHGVMEDRLKFLRRAALEKIKNGGDDDEMTEEELAALTSKATTFTKASLASCISLRPWNARLKTLCWKLGESFVKVSGKEGSFYGRFYAERYAEYTARNERKEYAAVARETIAKYSKATQAYKALSQDMLPKAQIFMRAKRITVKMFLSHLYEQWQRKVANIRPERPWIIAHGGHSDYVAPPEKEK